jgi:hypothetical protein
MSNAMDSTNSHASTDRYFYDYQNVSPTGCIPSSNCNTSSPMNSLVLGNYATDRYFYDYPNYGLGNYAYSGSGAKGANSGLNGSSYVPHQQPQSKHLLLPSPQSVSQSQQNAQQQQQTQLHAHIALTVNSTNNNSHTYSPNNTAYTTNKTKDLMLLPPVPLPSTPTPTSSVQTPSSPSVSSPNSAHSPPRGTSNAGHQPSHHTQQLQQMVQHHNPQQHQQMVQHHNPQQQMVPRNDGGGPRFVDITEYLNLPQNIAAQKLNIPTSTLSKRWKAAVSSNRKWPFRVVSKLGTSLMTCLVCLVC